MSAIVSPLVRAIIDSITGQTIVKCDLKSADCTFVQKHFPTPIEFICQSAGCSVISAPPHPSKPTNYIWVKIVVPVVFLVIIIALIGARIKYNRWKESVLEENWHHLGQLKHSETLVAWKNIKCTLSSGRVILKEVSGTAHPGKLTAILGASGAGKTTLIDILAQRKNTGTIAGQILQNGKPLGKNYKRTMGYVLQEDKMIGTLTVYEHLLNIALLRLPSSMPYKIRLQRVDAVLEDLGISHIKDSFIGTDLERGISGGERKRLSIASELVTDPAILYLDEPTSGLGNAIYFNTFLSLKISKNETDSHTAYALMTSLKELATESKRTIIMSIHQVNITHSFLRKAHNILLYDSEKRFDDFF